MNKLKGKVKYIEASGNILLIHVDVDGNSIVSIVLNPVQSYREGQDVYVLFKETEVSIAKNLSGEISLRNRFKCRIESIERGKLLSKVIMRWNNEKITSIITTNSVDRLSLQEGDDVLAFVKTNEITLMEM